MEYGLESSHYVEAVEDFSHLKDSEFTSIFLAGGISNCPNWQETVVKSLCRRTGNWSIINPRREDFNTDDEQLESLKQVHWEHKALRVADSILFWFPKDTLCPITLYELGAWSMTDKPLFIGTDPEYKRRDDVLIQTALIRPQAKVTDNLEDLVQQALDWKKGFEKNV